jgi:hypothetical protein
MLPIPYMTGLPALPLTEGARWRHPKLVPRVEGVSMHSSSIKAFGSDRKGVAGLCEPITAMFGMASWARRFASKGAPKAVGGEKG